MLLARLGPRLDGWADLIEGSSEKTNAVLERVATLLQDRGNPSVTVERFRITQGGLNPQERSFLFAHLSNGATCTVFVAARGCDLYASWNLYVRPMINWINLGSIAGLALLLNGPLLVMSAVSGLATAVQTLRDGGFTFLGFLCGGLGGYAATLSVLLAIASLISRIVKGSALAFLLKELTAFDADDIAAMTLAVHKSLLQALDGVGIATATLRL